MTEGALYPIPTRDPVTGAELVVTRLESPASGLAIEGRFTLGWVGRLTPDQLEFVGQLLRNRNNLQKLANDLGVAYNTARSRLDDVVRAVGGSPDGDDERPRATPAASKRRREILDALASGQIDLEAAQERLDALRGE